ncbi:hypothetical protein [Burkholderia sp. WAC0059]|uniref:hypothetical protein n=1 Tax=Burkholderia sp. WAC0059 TaxID=2066022 RepID=UPI0011AFA538|nr:hypothetical protein [Burkholderia sp. WAC0059]
MANPIVGPHPLDSVPFDSDLAITLEIVDVLSPLTSEARLEELATACLSNYPLAAAYLLGIIETRRFSMH